ncbi:MAG: heat-inducible transcription repressor HrcA [Polyangiaceae bacterium]|nr:heat-inducible transcription repressor HrcA [Polyangiaceae bacterium]MCW5789633.1 heat-inducible transcription repressor HrcA [Polyangiaceae bacterium]
MNQRARSVLYAVVSEFIATGQPVSSRTLSRKHGFDFSTATIRNVMADLEDQGYLAQPHTSSGRIPTEAAFRLFIDALMRVRDLSQEEAQRIQELFAEAKSGDWLSEAGRLLSDLTGTAAILVRSRAESRTLLKIQFVPTRPGELLSVVVFSDGTVENRFIQTDQTQSVDLVQLHNLLDGVVEGRTLSGLREHLASQVSQGRDRLRELGALGVALIDASLAGSDRRLDVVIEGRAKLLDREGEDSGRSRELLAVLESREQLVALLDRIMGSQRVQVFLGEETRSTVGYPVTLIAAPFGEGGRPAGAIGVIGGARMDYPFVVPLVGATADVMTEAARRRSSPDTEEP